jgi:soluble lytic murein transglycosylase-like protein
MKQQPVIWTKTHEKVTRNLRKWLIFTNLFWIIISVFFYLGWTHIDKVDPEALNLKNQVKEYKARDEVFNILRVKGYSLSQGMDIANALIFHARENKVPLGVGLGIMKQESRFYIGAVSNKGAKGLMQIMEGTFDSYNEAFKMGLSKQAIFDPIVNIRISMLHLRDIYGEVEPVTKRKSDIWPGVLKAYSGNAKNYSKIVLASSEEFEERLNAAHLRTGL